MVSALKPSTMALIHGASAPGILKRSGHSIEVDCRDFTAATSQEKTIFCKLFVGSIYDGFRKGSAKSTSAINKFKGRIGEYFGAKSYGLVSKLLRLEILKDENGKIIGGFGYLLKENELHIGSIMLLPSNENKIERTALLAKMAKRIKEIAQNSGVAQITCIVDGNNKGLRKLYQKAGFKETVEMSPKKVCHLEANTEDFCKNYF